jgi:hypothetical protein
MRQLTPNRTLFLALLACIMLWPAGSLAIDEGTGWHQPYVTLLDVDFPQTGFHARWEYFHCECGDILVRLEQSAPDGVLTGELLLIDGQVLLARGMVSQVPDLEPMMQAPTLMLQTTFGLLQRAIPKGPAAVEISSEIEFEEKDQPLSINTGMAFGEFGIPWSVTGKAWRAGPSRRQFDLAFEFSNPLPDDPDNSDQIQFSGAQDYGTDSFPLHEDTPLEGWTVQWMSKGETEATAPEDGLTLSELRTQAKELSGL